MGALIDLMGQRFGHWTVIERAPSRNCRAVWRCRCDCGAVLEVGSDDLRFGKSTKCAKCMGRLVTAPRSTTHAKSETREYRQWITLKTRCYNKNHKSYQFYGALGVKLYKPWVKDFAAFYAHVGDAPSPYHTLDRHNLSGDFAPGNIFWSSVEGRPERHERFRKGKKNRVNR